MRERERDWLYLNILHLRFTSITYKRSSISSLFQIILWIDPASVEEIYQVIIVQTSADKLILFQLSVTVDIQGTGWRFREIYFYDRLRYLKTFYHYK